jgi:hypothetical protein
MCTVLYNRDFALLCKNRDKEGTIQEEVVQTGDYIATRTVNADYFSLGLNRYGVAFASTAINSPKWIAAVERGDLVAANDIYKAENKGLERPTSLISKMFPRVRHIDEFAERFEKCRKSWLGYNIVIADRMKGMIFEVHGDQLNSRTLQDTDALTNHFKYLNQGPRFYKDYPSSFERLTLSNSMLQNASCRDDVMEIMKLRAGEEKNSIWRQSAFHTVSSTCIDLQKIKIYRTDHLSKDYKSFSFH